jgi:hypothetical protein
MIRKLISVTFVLFFITFFQSIIYSQTYLEKLTGNWKGKGDIIVTWCSQDSLFFNITIKKDGKVSGTVGNAKINYGKISKRSVVMKLLGNGEYLIKGYLDGYLVKSEGIKRKSFILMFNFKDGKIQGEMHSSGSKFGGKEEMVMTVTGVVLKKSS